MSAPTRSPWLSLAGLIAVLAILLGLGTWQLHRRAWKTDLLTTIERRTALPPVSTLPLDECRPDRGLADPCQYLPVSVEATFNHAVERHVFISVPVQADGVGGPGYWVFTLAHVGSGRSLFVNRGFVPQSAKLPARRMQGQTSGSVRLIGQLRQAEVRGTFSGANDPGQNIYFVRSPDEFITNIDLPAPRPNDLQRRTVSTTYYIDQTAPFPPGGLPRPLVGKIAIPNRHLEYALTWYALALTLLGVVIVYRRGRRTVNDG